MYVLIITQEEYVCTHPLTNRDAWGSNDNKQTVFSTDHKFTTKFTNHTKAAICCEKRQWNIKQGHEQM